MSVRRMMSVRSWKNILDTSKHAGGEAPLTHTSYKGGKFHLPMTAEDWKIYEEVAKEEQQYLIERPLEYCSPVIAIDFDFRFAPEITTRQHDEYIIDGICREIAETVHHITEPEPDFSYYMAVEHKNITDLAKTDNGKQTKDGFHIKLGIRATREAQQLIRDILLRTMPDKLASLPLANDIADIIDPAVLGGVNGITMPLSAKPNDRPYELTHLYQVRYDDGGNIESVVLQDGYDDLPPSQLSIRNPDLPEVLLSAECPEVASWKTRPANFKVKSSVTRPSVAVAPIADPPAPVVAEIERRTTDEDARDYNSWWKVCVKILKWCDAKGYKADEGRNAVHYFSRRCPSKYDTARVDAWIVGIDYRKFHLLSWRDATRVNAIHLSTLFKGAGEVADCIAEELRQRVIYDGKLWWLCSQETNMWVNANPHRTIVKSIHSGIYASLELLKQKKRSDDDDDGEDGDKKERQSYMKFFDKTDGTTYISGVKQHLEDLLRDTDFSVRRNSLFGSLAFRNGVLDMATRQFRQGILPEDYLTETIACDWNEPDARELSRVKGIIWDICSHNTEYEAFLYRQLGYCMSGFADKEQAFFFWEGLTASNGKSTIMEALAKTPYVIKLHNETFKQDNAKYHKHIHELKRNPRIAWLNEPARAKGVKMDETKLKEFADGCEIKNEVMFGTIEPIYNHAKLIITDNASPVVANPDKGYERRLMMLVFGSKFYNQQDWETLTASGEVDMDKNFIADNSVIGYMKTDGALLALLSLILGGFADYNRQGLNPPAVFQTAKAEAVSTTDPFGEYVRQHFRKCVGSNLGKVFINQHYNSDINGSPEDKRDYSQTLVKALKRIGYDYNSQRSYRHKDKVMSGMVMDIEYVALECDEEGEEYQVW